MHQACGQEPEVRQELTVEVLAKAVTRGAYISRMICPQASEVRDPEHCEWRGAREEDTLGVKQAGLSTRGQPWKSISDGRLQKPGTSRRRQSS